MSRIVRELSPLNDQTISNSPEDAEVSSSVDDDLLQRMYRSLFRIRRVEEEIACVYPTDVIKSPVHLSIGQEAVAVGVCETLSEDDIVFGSYRSHAMYLAKGGNLNRMIAELFGKVTGCAQGKGGSMHLIDVSAGVMGTSAVVGTTIPNAVGYAYALKLQGKNAVVVSFLGEGATEEGVFHESLNFAALKKLSVIFICENNRYAIHTHQSRRQASLDICGRVRSYGIPAERIEDNDVLQIYDRVNTAVTSLRANSTGPMFFECMTYRWKEHVGPHDDFDLGYRTPEEARPWIENDQVLRLKSMLDHSTSREMETEIEAEIKRAFDLARQAPFPSPEQLETNRFD